MNIAPTTDTNGLADMISAAAGGSLNYDIQVDTAGSYPLNFRVAGATGQIKCTSRRPRCWGQPIFTQASWSTVSTTVTLAAGTQTLHVVLSANSQQLNWMEFQPVNGPVSVPTGVNATAGNAQVVLSWSTAAGATSYKIQSSTTKAGLKRPSQSDDNQLHEHRSGKRQNLLLCGLGDRWGQVSSNSIEVSATPRVVTVNLALNKPVTVSSTQAGDPGSYAVDGNTTTTDGLLIGLPRIGFMWICRQPTTSRKWNFTGNQLTRRAFKFRFPRMP